MEHDPRPVARSRGGYLLAELKPGTVPHVIADAAYDSECDGCIRPNPTRKWKKRYHAGRDKNRNVIERFFGRIKR